MVGFEKLHESMLENRVSRALEDERIYMFRQIFRITPIRRPRFQVNIKDEPN